MSSHINPSFANLLRTLGGPPSEEILSSMPNLIASKSRPPRKIFLSMDHRKKESMDPNSYLRALAAVDVTNSKEFHKFIGDTQILGVELAPIPVPLGVHAEIQYFLESATDAIDDGDNGYMVSFQAQSFGPGTPAIDIDLRYGFGIGRLWFRPISQDTEPASWHNLWRTDYYVICSATDKSIWAAFDFFPIDQGDEIDPIRPEEGDGYGGLPNKGSDDNIGIQKLFGGEWTTRTPLTLGDSDPFCNALGGGSPIQARLTTKEVPFSEIADAIRAAHGN